MASLLSWLGNVASGIERQLNPFDGGATYSNPNPQQKQPIAIPNYHPNPGVVNSINQATGSNYGGQPAPAQGSVLRSAPRAPIVIPDYHTVQAPIQAPGIKVNALNALVNPAGAATRWLASPQGRQTTISLAQGLARTAPELATTVGALKDQSITYHPNSPLEKTLFGSTPVQNIQAKMRDTQAKHGTAAAIGEGALSLLQDVPTGAGAAKVVGKAGKAIHETGQIGAVGKDISKVAKATPEQLASQKALEYAKNAANFDAKGNFKASIQKELGGILEGKPAPATKVTTPVAPKTAPVAPETAPAVTKNYRPRIPAEPVQNVNPLSAKLLNKPAVLEKIGTPSSQLAASKIRATDKLGADLRAGYRNTAQTALSLSKDEFNNLGDVIEHGAKPMNPKVAQAATEAKATLPKVHSNFTAAGGKTGKIENYFPRDYSGMKKGSSGYNQGLQHLLDTGQAKSTGEAVSILDRLRSADNTKPGFFGSFDRSRFDVPGYTYSKTAFEKYLNGAAQRTAEATHFGPKGEVANKLVGNIAREGGDANLAKNAIQNYLHDASIGKTDFLAGARGVMGTARLGKAAVSHLGQGSNVKLYTRVADHLKAQAQWLTRNPEARQFIKESDVNNPANIHGYTQQYSSIKGAMSKVTAPGLEQMMKVHRGVAALAGRNYGNYLARTGNVAELRQKWGVTGDIGKTLTQSQEHEIARSMADTTMGNPSRATTPVGAETPAGKTIGQYRLAYGYKQTGRIYNQVIKEAGNGNIKPLLKFIAFSAPLGAGTVIAKNAISGHSEGPGGTALDTIGALGGIPGELAVQGGRYLKGNVLKTVAGSIAPLAGEAVDIGQKAQTALGKSHNVKPLEGYIAGLVPGIGSRLKSAVNPYNPPGTTASGNKTLDQAIANLKTTKGQPGGKWEDYVPKEDATIAKLSAAQQQELINQGTITQTDVTRANKLEATAKQDLGAPKKIDTAGLTGADTSFLQRYNRLSADGKAKFNGDAGNLYQMGQIKYNQSTANGKLSRAQDINAQENLAKLKVNAMKGGDGSYLFSKDVTSAYGLSKGEIADLLDSPGGQDLANKVVAYGDELVKAGAIAKNKWRDSKGRVSLTSSSSGSGGSRGKGSSGTKVTKTITTGYKTAGAMKAPKAPSIKIKSPKSATFKAPSTKKLAVSKIPSSYTHRKLG